MPIINITREPVELFKLLKFENLASSGGEAKQLIAQGLISVNGKVEHRKRCKIRDGDTIEIAGQCFLIALADS